jgi:hypothetical protein
LIYRIHVRNIAQLLIPGGTFYVVEPAFHVSDPESEETLIIGKKAGFRIEDRPNIFMSRAAVFVKE